MPTGDRRFRANRRFRAIRDEYEYPGIIDTHTREVALWSLGEGDRRLPYLDRVNADWSQRRHLYWTRPHERGNNAHDG